MDHRIAIHTSLINNIWLHLCMETAPMAAGSQYSLMRWSRAHDAMHELILSRETRNVAAATFAFGLHGELMALRAHSHAEGCTPLALAS